MFNKFIRAILENILYTFTHPPSFEGNSIEVPEVTRYACSAPLHVTMTDIPLFYVDIYLLQWTIHVIIILFHYSIIISNKNVTLF